MSKRVFSGKTVKSAVSKGLQELGVSEEDVIVTILEHPTKGLLGLIGGRDAKVELTLRPKATVSATEFAVEPVAAERAAPASASPVVSPPTNGEHMSSSVDDPIARAKSYLADVLRAMELDATIEQSTDEDDNVVFHVSGRDLGTLIGRRGQTLDAMQALVNVYANRVSDGHWRIVLDAERFRERRKKTLQDLSLRLANQVIRTKKEVVLEPMSPNERRIIHYQLQNHPKVKTYSKGEEPNRRIVITLK